MTSRTLRRVLATAALVLLFVFFWPIQFGGPFGWLTTTGNSMHPRVDQGDLVLLRSSDTPRVGDVVAYNSRELHRVVLHRVIEVTPTDFVTKGDHNNFVDGERPTRSAMIGRMVYVIPGVGKYLIGFTTPLGILSIVIFAVGGVYLWRLRRKKVGDPATGSGTRSTVPGRASLTRLSNPETLKRVLLAGGGVVACVGLVLTLFIPASEQHTREYVYNNTGVFEYVADAGGPNAVYPDGFAHTKDPIYLQLATKTHFTFTFRSDAPKAAKVAGVGAMKALITDQDGWHYEIPLAAPRSFTDRATKLEGDLDLAQVQWHLAVVQYLTGVKRPQYNVAIVVDMSVSTSVGDAHEEKAFAPSLLFRLDARSLVLATGDPKANSLTPAQGGTIQTSVTTPNRLSILGLEATVSALRVLVLLALLGIAAAVFALHRWAHLLGPAPPDAPGSDQASPEPPDDTGAAPAPGESPNATEAIPQDENARIAMEYGPILVPLPPENFYVETDLTTVESIEELAAMGAPSGALIMHTAVGPLHIYQVSVDSKLYRYTVSTPQDTGAAGKAKSTAAKKTATNKKPAARKSAPGKRTTPTKKVAGPKRPTRAERTLPPRENETTSAGDTETTPPDGDDAPETEGPPE